VPLRLRDELPKMVNLTITVSCQIDGARLGGPGEDEMIAVVASQLLSFILGGGAFLLRHDRGDFA
jgi:hypothetical protein